MDYQLVLQFPAKTDEEADRLLTLEDDFIEALEDSADLEGHEPENDVMNFFIATTDPEDSFERIRPLLEDKGLLKTVIGAYRDVDEDEYTVFWPEDDKEKKFKTPA